MTASQVEVAELLRDLKRPAELIAANSGISINDVKRWLRTGRWPKPLQRTLFDATGYSPRPETTQPEITSKGNHGLSLFSR